MAVAALALAGAPATQRASDGTKAPKQVAVPAENPAATAPATPTTSPVDEHHKAVDPRLREMVEQQRRPMRSRWDEAPIVQTFTPGTLVNLSLNDGMLSVDITDLTTALPSRVAVEGSKAVWILTRRGPMLVGLSGNAYVSLVRYNFDAKDDEPWQASLFMNGQIIALTAQSVSSTTRLTQCNGSLNLRVYQNTQFGQPPKTIRGSQASSLLQLRAEQPADFRQYVMPLLALFGDSSFLKPGATDVYSLFTQIPADAKVAQDVIGLLPMLDADDPAQRDLASARLEALGPAGVLAVLRMDRSALPEEQKLRLQAYVARHRHYPGLPSALPQERLSFLVDCLEYDDAAVRLAAKSAIAAQTRQSVDFDTSLTGDDAAKAADALRRRLLAPAPIAAPTTAPSTQPSPQS